MVPYLWNPLWFLFALVNRVVTVFSVCAAWRWIPKNAEPFSFFLFSGGKVVMSFWWFSQIVWALSLFLFQSVTRVSAFTSQSHLTHQQYWWLSIIYFDKSGSWLSENTQCLSRNALWFDLIWTVMDSTAESGVLGVAGGTFSFSWISADWQKKSVRLPLALPLDWISCLQEKDKMGEMTEVCVYVCAWEYIGDNNQFIGLWLGPNSLNSFFCWKRQTSV